MQALRERLSKLSEASLRISESLDVNTVLREVVESARALTSAGCSGITTMDASGHLQDFVTSGVSPEEYQRFLHLPHGPGLWEYLRAIPQPLRLRDLAAHGERADRRLMSNGRHPRATANVVPRCHSPGKCKGTYTVRLTETVSPGVLMIQLERAESSPIYI